MKKRHNINIHEELNKLAITALMGFLLITIIPCEEYLILNILIDAIYIRIGILMIWVLFFVFRFVKALEDEIMILAGYSYWLMVIYMIFILVLTIYTRDLPYLLDTVDKQHTNMAMFEEVAAAAKKALLKSSYEKSYYCAATGITKKTYILTGEKYTILGQKHLLFLNYKEGKFIDAQIIKTKNYYISNKELIPDNKDGELCLELIQKMQLQKDIFNYNKLHTNESLQVYFTNSKQNLQPLIEKGGDAIIVESKTGQLVCIELKFRWKPFPTPADLEKYIDDMKIAYEKKLIISIDCDSDDIYVQILNYVKDKPDSFNQFYCFSKDDLKNPLNVAELELLPYKARYFNFVVKNASYLHEPMTQEELDNIEIAMEQSLNGMTPEEYVNTRSDLQNKIKSPKAVLQLKNTDGSLKLYNKILETSKTNINLIKYDQSKN